MIRVILSDLDKIEEGRIVIRESESLRHLRVLRARQGEACEVLNTQGKTWSCYIEKIDDKNAVLLINSVLEQQRKAPEIVICASLVPSKKFDVIVEKTAEFGIDGILPLVADRSIVRAVDEKRYRRWDKICKETLKQCGAPFLPRIYPAKSVSDAVDFLIDNGFDIYVFALKFKNKMHVIDALKASKPSEKMAFFVGPEGDFTDSEIDYMLRFNAQAASLGDNVLRVETACAYVCGIGAYIKEAKSGKFNHTHSE